MGKDLKFKAQHIMVEDNQATALEGTLTAVGIERKFGKMGSGYLMYSSLEEEQGGATTNELDSVSLGYVIKF